MEKQNCLICKREEGEENTKFTGRNLKCTSCINRIQRFCPTAAEAEKKIKEAFEKIKNWKEKYNKIKLKYKEQKIVILKLQDTFEENKKLSEENKKFSEEIIQLKNTIETYNKIFGKNIGNLRID